MPFHLRPERSPNVEVEEIEPHRSSKAISTTNFQDLIDFLDRREAEIKEILRRRKYEEISEFWPLCRAVQENDWKTVENFVSRHPESLTAKITEFSETIFHKIVCSGENAIWLVKKFASQVSPEALEAGDSNSDTALSYAAIFGNTKAAKIFVNRNRKLANMRNCNGFLPIHLAAWFGHKETVNYLLTVTDLVRESDAGDSHFVLLKFLISSNLFGIALELLNQYPELTHEMNNRKIVLEILAKKPLEFASGNRLGFWKNLSYYCIPVNGEHVPYLLTKKNDISTSAEENPDMENQTERSKNYPTNSTTSKAFGYLRNALHQELRTLPWNALTHLAPGIKHIYDKKLTHMQAHKIVRTMCDKKFWKFEQASESLKMPILTAAKLGIHEIVEEIMKAYFYSFIFFDKDGHNIFKLAVLHRQEKVFNLIYQMVGLKDWVCWTNETESLPRGYLTRAADFNDKSGNNILHLAAKLVPSRRVPGAALQMQRELQWFKVVENLFPSLQEQQNSLEKTPGEMFTEEHMKLVKEGEKWMKDTASSCTVVATLVITVVFAAAFTVPGGNNDGGIPNFLHEKSLLMFAISDALALVSSTTSLLMFLGILTSRYSEEDFLESLPKKLIIGLVTLFVSIASMMVAFAATMYIVFSHPWKRVIIPMALLGCVPVTLFASLQFPLLVEMFLSTYRPSLLKPIK